MPAKVQLPEKRKPHHPQKGSKEFVNPWPSFTSHGMMEFFKMSFNGEWDSERSKPPPEDQRVQVITPDFQKIRSFASAGKGKIAATWLGHAAFLVQMGGLNVLADPCCSERCSPTQWAGPARIRPMPCKLEELGPVDAVIISHSHYDHLDYNTISALGDKVTYFVPLGIGAWFKSNFPTYKCVELDWWDSADLKGVEFHCLPVQHFSGRTLWDRNRTLWASWAIKSADARFYFAGDTGYRSVPKGFTGKIEDLPTCPAFKEIGERLGPFDLSAIPIGAYSPRFFMSPIHCDPEDAVCVHKDVRSKKSVGMHWGTFILTDEPVVEPPLRLVKEAARAGLEEDEFVVVKIGETLVV